MALTAARTIGWSFWWSPCRSYGTDGSMVFMGGDMGCGFFLVFEVSVVLAKCVFLVYPLTQRQAEQPRLGAEPRAISRQSTEAFRRISFPGFLARAFALGNVVHYFLMASFLAVMRPLSSCCMWNTELDSSGDVRFFGRSAWLDSGYMFCISTWRSWTNFAPFLR